MIIKSFELEKLKLKIGSLHLIYGNNEGIKNDIINNIYLKNFTGEVLKYDENEVLNAEELFLLNLLNNSLFEKNKLNPDDISTIKKKIKKT